MAQRGSESLSSSQVRVYRGGPLARFLKLKQQQPCPPHKSTRFLMQKEFENVDKQKQENYC